LIVGVPKEIKDNEYRVGITPAGADTLVRAGNKVLIEKGAGLGSGFKDEEYEKVGAEIARRIASTSPSNERDSWQNLNSNRSAVPH